MDTSKIVIANRPAASPARAVQAAAELCEVGPMLAKPYDPQILLDQIERLIAKT